MASQDLVVVPVGDGVELMPYPTEEGHLTWLQIFSACFQMFALYIVTALFRRACNSAGVARGWLVAFSCLAVVFAPGLMISLAAVYGQTALVLSMFRPETTSRGGFPLLTVSGLLFYPRMTLLLFALRDGPSCLRTLSKYRMQVCLGAVALVMSVLPYIAAMMVVEFGYSEEMLATLLVANAVSPRM